MRPACEHPRFEERYGRTWESISAEFEIQVSHRFCLVCRTTYGKELWQTQRAKEGAA